MGKTVRRVAVIGGGASGMMAAITAAAHGAAVTVYERNDRVGKKILATGNGKCNFSNRDFGAAFYYGNTGKLEDCFAQFSVSETIRFFEEAGMLVKEKRGYLYPWSEQASTVLDVLRLEMERHGVATVLSARVGSIRPGKKDGVLEVRLAEGMGTERYDAVILACGGCAAPKTGSDGSGFRLAEAMGHRIVPVVPALVQLRCAERFLKAVAGVRCEAGLRLYEMYGKDQKGPLLQEETGELQFTDYGISGIPVFQLSRQAAYLIKNGKQAAVAIDLLPQLAWKDLEAMCSGRIKDAGGKTVEEFLLGIANKKINGMMIKEAGYRPGDKAGGLGEKRLRQLLYSYKELWVHISAANPFENAQVTAGGVDMEEVSQTLESVKMPGVYFAGEMLDVDGRCGGYNLQWAWTSGYIAGKNAAVR